MLVHGDKLFISYSASATDENYCMGLLWIDREADPLQPENWHKAPQPVFRTSYENRQYGPGHNSFTQTPAGKMCWYITRGITPRLKATRCMIPIVIRG